MESVKIFLILTFADNKLKGFNLFYLKRYYYYIILIYQLVDLETARSRFGQLYFHINKMSKLPAKRDKAVSVCNGTFIGLRWFLLFNDKVC